jgi:hypothetical protein
MKHSRYNLSRIQLPDYEAACHFESVMPLALCARSPLSSRFVAAQEGEGVNTCDYPLEFDEKAVWAGLDNYAPAVAQLIQRFFLIDEISLAIRNTIVEQRVGVVAAVCKWLQAAENIPVWESWLPPSRYWVQCELGEIVSDGKACIPCPGWARFASIYRRRPSEQARPLHATAFHALVVQLRSGGVFEGRLLYQLH